VRGSLKQLLTTSFLAEQYFNGQYSLQQKSVLLTSIAMGARELAGLPVPQPISSNRRIDFPTKVLPPALHQKYIGSNDLPPATTYGNQLEEAIDGVRDLMLSKSARKGEETIPELARDKKLRVGPGRTTKIAELGSLAERNMMGNNGQVSQAPIVPFKDVAAEYFIMPLVNRFWLHFQDSATRESRAMATGDRYRGAGTGMILSPLALEKLLMTLSLLLHASRHSPLFLSILAPEIMELGITIGSRHLPSPSNNPMITDLDTAGMDEGSKTEAQVLAAALEMFLVALDISFELDKGRTLAMDKAELVLAAGEWASGVFEIERKGGEVSAGQGGMREGRVRATAAGVVVKIAEIGEKWVAVGGRMR
jgi:telomere length regulation protein